MKDVEISPTVQLTLLTVLAAAIVAAIAAQMPELRRYMKIRSM